MIAGNGSYRISDPRLKEIGSITNLRQLIGESGEDSDLTTYEGKVRKAHPSHYVTLCMYGQTYSKSMG